MRKTPWRLHDLRRTCTTGLARLGIPPHVADRVLNHQRGVDERRDALQAWGGYIEQLLDPERGMNIVALRA
jgi:hypothetical protein